MPVMRRAKLHSRRLGTAIPQLRAAVDSPDPQIRLEVRDALHALDRPPLPKTSKNHAREHITVTAFDEDEGTGTVEITDGDLKMVISLKYGNRGINTDIKITISGPVDGTPTRQEIEAQDATQLKWIAPEVWKVYNGYFNIANQRRSEQAADPELEKWVWKQIAAAHLGPDDAKKLKDSLKAAARCRHRGNARCRL